MHLMVDSMILDSLPWFRNTIFCVSALLWHLLCCAILGLVHSQFLNWTLQPLLLALGWCRLPAFEAFHALH